MKGHDRERAQEAYQHESGAVAPPSADRREIHPTSSRKLPHATCRRQLAVGPQGFCRGESPSPRNRRFRRRPRPHHHHQENPPRTPRSASISRDVSRALTARYSFSSLFFFSKSFADFCFSVDSRLLS